MPLLLLSGFIVPSTGAAQGVEVPHIPLRTALMEINTLRSSYADAFNQKNATAVADMYTEDAIIINGDGTKLAGDSAITAFMTAEAPNWPHAVIESDTVRVYGSTAVDVGTFTQHPASGGEQVSRYIAVLRRDMNGWKLTNVAVVPVTEPAAAAEP